MDGTVPLSVQTGTQRFIFSYFLCQNTSYSLQTQYMLWTVLEFWHPVELMLLNSKWNFTESQQQLRKMTLRSIKAGTRGADKLGDWDWHIHTTIYKIDNKDLLYSTGNTTHYSVMAYMGKESKKEWIYVYVQLIHFTVHLKLTQHCKSTILQ